MHPFIKPVTVVMDDDLAWRMLARVATTEGIAAAVEFASRTGGGLDVSRDRLVAALQRRGYLPAVS